MVVLDQLLFFWSDGERSLVMELQLGGLIVLKNQIHGRQLRELVGDQDS